MGLGKGHLPSPLPASPAPHPRTPRQRVSQPPPARGARPRSPAAGGPGFRKPSAEFPFPARERRAAKPAPGRALPARAARGREALRQPPPPAPGPEPRSALSAPRGLLQPDPRPLPRAGHPADGRRRSGPYSPGPPDLPAPKAAAPGRVARARADAGAPLPAGPSYSRRAGPPAEQRGPSPAGAGRGGPRGGAGQPRQGPCVPGPPLGPTGPTPPAGRPKFPGFGTSGRAVLKRLNSALPGSRSRPHSHTQPVPRSLWEPRRPQPQRLEPTEGMGSVRPQVGLAAGRCVHQSPPNPRPTSCGQRSSTR